MWEIKGVCAPLALHGSNWFLVVCRRKSKKHASPNRGKARHYTRTSTEAIAIGGVSPRRHQQYDYSEEAQPDEFNLNKIDKGGVNRFADYLSTLHRTRAEPVLCTISIDDSVCVLVSIVSQWPNLGSLIFVLLRIWLDKPIRKYDRQNCTKTVFCRIELYSLLILNVLSVCVCGVCVHF